MPLSALVTRKTNGEVDHRIARRTYGGNAVACAAAVATLRVIKEKLLDNVNAARTVDGWLTEVAAGISVIGEVRGKGLMVATELPKTASRTRRHRRPW